jgi:hypothetical protein
MELRLDRPPEMMRVLLQTVEHPFGTIKVSLPLRYPWRVNAMRGARLLFILLGVLLILSGCASTGPNGPAGVVGGTAEPDYKYPWVVRVNGPCGGVLIHPEWVLTAGHCILPLPSSRDVFYRRTDPYTGAVYEETRVPGTRGVFRPLDYNVPGLGDNDLALIRLAQPFSISPYIQTVGLPSSPIAPGLVGTVASFSHTTMLPPDKVAIFRAPVAPLGFGKAFLIGTSDATGALCPGDSGSGFVTYENGRATVRGIVSEASGDCVTPSGHLARFIDVFLYRDWILETIRMPDYFLAGNTLVRWSGRVARGVMGIGCPNRFGTMWGPLNVLGVEEGANCEAGESQTVVCSLSGAQIGPVGRAITGFTMKTECPPFPASVASLLFTPTWASYYGPAPVHPNPLGVCQREFTCRVGFANLNDPADGSEFAP